MAIGRVLSTKVLRVVLALVVAGSAMAVVPPSGAVLGTTAPPSSTLPVSNPLPIGCVAGGTVHFSEVGDGTVQINIASNGVCAGDFNDPYDVTIKGVGRARTYGLCSSDLLVTDLAIDVQATFVQVASGVTVTQQQLWTAPVSTNPVTMPFTIRRGADLAGGGTLFTRIFLNCPPAGTPAATFEWVQRLA